MHRHGDDVIGELCGVSQKTYVRPTLVFSRHDIDAFAEVLGMHSDQFCTAYNVVESPELPTSRGLT